MVILTREQLEERLSTLHQASLELVGVLSLDEVLKRIADLAREQAGARYAALGLMGENGQIERFIPIGMTPHQIEQIGDLIRAAKAFHPIIPKCIPSWVCQSCRATGS